MTDPTIDLAEIKRLAACPFCGGDGIPDVMTTGGAEQHYIRCRSCAAEGPWGNHLSTAVDSWNRREPPAAAEQERDRLRVVAEAVAEARAKMGGFLAPDQTDYAAADVYLSAPTAAGYVLCDTATHAVVPREATISMLEAGHEAYRSAHTSGVSGMTIDAQIRSQCARVGAAWAAMLAAAEAEAKGGDDVG